MDILNFLFDSSGFAPRWYCGTAWTQALGWTHIISDIVIFISYTSIPITLLYFLNRRKDLPFHNIILLFGAFILFCGFGHLIEAYIFWNPIYRFSALIQVLTAAVSFVTAGVMIYLIPAILNLPKYAELRSYLASVLESSVDSILSFDNKGCLTSYNKSANRFFGLSEKAIGKPIFSCVPNLFESKGHINEILEELSDKGEYSSYERSISIGGTDYDVLVTTASVVSMDDKTNLGGSLTIKDISYENKIKESLRNANAELEKFAFIVAHDLKAPLRHVSYFVDKLEKMKTKRSEEEKETINHICQSIIFALQSIIWRSLSLDC